MGFAAGGEAAAVSARFHARLHLGFLDLDGALGRRFGSLGLSIAAPAGHMTLQRARATHVEGPESERASRYLAATLLRLSLPGQYRLAIHDAIPPHAGLGSGTQLALAVAASLRRLNGLAPDASADAAALGRGARSGVGVGLFELGGFVVDGGRGTATATPPIVARLEFPADWRVVLVLDPGGVGVHGEAEREAFKALPLMPGSQAAEICRLTLMQALPSLAERDIGNFGAAIAEIQRRLGDYFAPFQGGRRFASAGVGAVVEALARAGAHGAGQSSWGPTGFAFAANAGEAERLAKLARGLPGAKGLEIRVVAGNNRGCEVASANAGARAAE